MSSPRLLPRPSAHGPATTKRTTTPGRGCSASPSNVLHHHRRSEGRRLTRLRAAPQALEAEFDLAESVAASVDGAAETARIAGALARLDDRYRDILLLVASTDLTYDEIARALGIPVGTVRSRLARGRRRLRELLDAGGQQGRDVNHVTPFTEGTPG